MMPRSRFEVDYSTLDNTLYKRSFRMTAQQLTDKGMTRVAFDVVRFSDGDMASKLWEVQSSDDGDYIVSVYDEPEVEKTASIKESSAWEALYSRSAGKLNVFYKGAQIASISADKLGVPEKDLPLVEQYLPEKLASNKALVAALLNELPAPAKNAAYSRYPELQ